MRTGKRGIQLDGYERMPELVDLSFARKGWDRNEFRHFRAEVYYPPVPATMTMDVKLPD